MQGGGEKEEGRAEKRGSREKMRSHNGGGARERIEKRFVSFKPGKYNEGEKKGREEDGPSGICTNGIVTIPQE